MIRAGRQAETQMRSKSHERGVSEQIRVRINKRESAYNTAAAKYRSSVKKDRNLHQRAESELALAGLEKEPQSEVYVYGPPVVHWV